MSERKYAGWFYVTALVTLALDQLTKATVRAWLHYSIPVIPEIFHLTPAQNTGAAFGLFPNATMFFIVVAMLACALFLWLGRKGFDRRRVAIAFGLMLGGASGNLIDRLRFGAVTDFLDFRIWPIFNLADTALTVGAFLLLFWSWRVGEDKCDDS